MASHEIGLMHASACVVMGGVSDGAVTCPHCGETIALERAAVGRVSVACPACAEESLLVRIVSVLHRAVRLSGELLTQLESLGQPVATSVRTPGAVYSLKVSRGAVVLLAMMWHRAEQTGSTKIESSVTSLARRLLTSREMVRRWIAELRAVDAIRELSSPEQRPRVWELLPVGSRGEEVGHAG